MLKEKETNCDPSKKYTPPPPPAEKKSPPSVLISILQEKRCWLGSGAVSFAKEKLTSINFSIYRTFQLFIALILLFFGPQWVRWILWFLKIGLDIFWPVITGVSATILMAKVMERFAITR
eukprot:GHVP01041336.1.p1 GENE.GHVP01041336.1~~GHVP01041336.1.p1  ORF type:complete len:120 (+),score=21.74 GHVP01041336.1:30-389(+)